MQNLGAGACNGSISLRKIIIFFGNSGSGKTTLARRLCEAEGLGHLDLDTLAWLPGTPPERMPLEESRSGIERFLGEQEGWVIEGCYSDLIEMALPSSTEMIYLDLPVEACVANARKRPWEPHKYESKAAQDANLDMLVDWIRRYDSRNDTFSRQAHERLFERYEGKKQRVRENRPELA